MLHKSLSGDYTVSILGRYRNRFKMIQDCFPLLYLFLSQYIFQVKRSFLSYMDILKAKGIVEMDTFLLLPMRFLTLFL
jgi:hypothetical protein